MKEKLFYFLLDYTPTFDKTCALVLWFCHLMISSLEQLIFSLLLEHVENALRTKGGDLHSLPAKAC